MAVGNYTMTLNHEKKQFYIYVEGIITAEMGAAYANEFIEKSKSIDSANWTLVVDVRKLSTVSPDSAKQLIEVLKLYLSFPYKKRYITKITNPICMVQVKKMGAATPGFDAMTWVDDVDNL